MPDAPADDSNALLLPASRKRSAPTAPPPHQQPTLTKAQKRKQRRIAEDRAARQQQATALATLHAHALSSDTASLMRSVAQRGQRLTAKEALRRDLALQRAGLPLPADSRLFINGADDAPGDSCTDDDEEQVWTGAVIKYAHVVDMLLYTHKYGPCVGRRNTCYIDSTYGGGAYLLFHTAMAGGCWLAWDRAQSSTQSSSTQSSSTQSGSIRSGSTRSGSTQSSSTQSGM